MASIIAQLVAAKRRRMENRKNSILISKSVYNLNSWDRCFKAEKHNNYIKNRSALNRKELVKTIAKGKVKQFKYISVRGENILFTELAPL